MVGEYAHSSDLWQVTGAVLAAANQLYSADEGLVVWGEIDLAPSPETSL